jgi:phosphomannomutase/phosphoglucomutase
VKLTLKKKKQGADKGNGSSEPAATPQGISASSNVLHKIALTAALAALVPVLLGFAYLLIMREPALQAQQLDRVASAFATQKATGIDRMLDRLNARLTNAAKTPAALSAIASPTLDNLVRLERDMLAYFPEARGLRIVPVGELGTADFTSGERGLRNHIEVDLVRKSSEDKTVQPESYQHDKTWLTSMVSKVTHPELPGRSAVLLLTLENNQIGRHLNSLYIDAGEFALEQTHIAVDSGKEKTVTIASRGESAGKERWFAEVPDTSWQVAFTPSKTLINDLSASKLPIYLVLALAVLAALASVAIFLRMVPQALTREIDRIIEASSRRSQLNLAIPELVTIAKQLRRATLRVLRQSEGQEATPATAEAETERAAPAASEAAGMASTMFQPTDMSDMDDEELDLDLDLEAANAPASIVREQPDPPPVSDDGLPGHIFRAYDIRGHAKDELTDELVAKIGGAIGTMADEIGEQALIVGCDGRSSSPRIKAVLVKALMEAGRDIIDIGVVPTPLLYFATRHLNYRSGVMITGSHNPGQDNGFKIVLNQQTIAAGGIQSLREKVANGKFVQGNGRLIRENVVPAYIDEVLHDIAIAVPLKVVIDAGNGVTGGIAPELFRELGCEVVPMYCEIDGSFPNHPPDTSDEKNLADLARAVKEHSADFGVAFDGDGDRLAVVTSSGRIVRTDVLLMLYAEDVVSRNPGADVVFDVKCSRNLTTLITQHGGRPVLWKTGHAFMKEKMQETGALLGGEFSGHIFFGERWFGFDDGMYAAARLAEIMSTQGESLDDAIDKFPVTVNTPEIIIPVADHYKFDLVDKIVSNADFASGKVNTMDGIRVDFSDGWGLVRASNTGPALTARFEADSAEHLEHIQEEFRAQIALIDPEVELRF